MHADLIARVEGGKAGGSRQKKILKIPIFGAEGDADLIDFNRFGEVVSRRAGIIHVIDFPVDGERRQKDFSDTTKSAKSTKKAWFSQLWCTWQGSLLKRALTQAIACVHRATRLPIVKLAEQKNRG